MMSVSATMMNCIFKKRLLFIWLLCWQYVIEEDEEKKVE